MTQATGAQEHPLITFFVMAYNQERYIRQAIEGAFSQTYSPLEIILSDDCSSDRTFDIMRESAAAYRGPHTVVLNRSERNLGIGGHVNRIMELAHGELIVAAAGDDISLPERVERTWQAYCSSGRSAMSIYANVTIIDEDGTEIGLLRRLPVAGLNDFSRRLENPFCSVTGCAHAWNRRVFDVFGRLRDDIVYEDTAIAFRATMLGPVHHVDEYLVLYRRHRGNITGYMPGPKGSNELETPAVLAFAARDPRRRLALLRNHLQDINVKNTAIAVSDEVIEKMKHLLLTKEAFYELEVQFIEGGLRGRFHVIWKGIVAGLGIRRITKWCVRLAFPFLYLRKVRERMLRGDRLERAT